METTVLSQSLPPEEIKRQFQIIDNEVGLHVPEQLFRFRSANLHGVMPFEHNTIMFCSADLFPDRFDSVVYVDKNKILYDVNLGFDWGFQKIVVDKVRQTGRLPEALVYLYGEANAKMGIFIYYCIRRRNNCWFGI